MKFNRTFKITAATFALALTSSIATADEKKHDEKFCAHLSSLNENITKLQGMGPDSKIGELKSTLKETRKNADDVTKEAKKMKSPSAKQFTQSANQLSTETKNIPDNMTVAQVKTRIKDDIQNVEQSAQALSDEAGCPGAMPKHPQGTEQQSTEPSGTQEPSGGQPPSGGQQPSGGGMEGQQPTR